MESAKTMESAMRKAEIKMRIDLMHDLDLALVLVHEFKQMYEWSGGWYYLEGFRPYMLTIKDLLLYYKIHMIPKVKEIHYEEILPILSVVREIMKSIYEKNRIINGQLTKCKNDRDNFFEPFESEMFRKIGDIVLLAKVCNMLEKHVLPGITFETFNIDRNTQQKVIDIGRNCRFGELSMTDIIDLMPDVSTMQFNTIMRFRKLREALIHTRADVVNHLPDVKFQKPEVEWTKRIDEMVQMSAFLLHHGYSHNWRMNILKKLNKIRPIVARGETTPEFEEAHAYLVNNYYRTRKAYEMFQNKLTRSDSFIKMELENAK